MPFGMPAATVTNRPESWPMLDGGKRFIPGGSHVEVLYPAADQDGFNRYGTEVVCRWGNVEIVVKKADLLL